MRTKLPKEGTDEHVVNDVNGDGFNSHLTSDPSSINRCVNQHGSSNVSSITR